MMTRLEAGIVLRILGGAENDRLLQQKADQVAAPGEHPVITSHSTPPHVTHFTVNATEHSMRKRNALARQLFRPSSVLQAREWMDAVRETYHEIRNFIS